MTKRVLMIVESPNKAKKIHGLISMGFITMLPASSKDADVIYVVTDPDREGEAMAVHVVNTFGKRHSRKNSRITYTEISCKAIQQRIYVSVVHRAWQSLQQELEGFGSPNNSPSDSIGQLPVPEKTEAQYKPTTRTNVTPRELCPACGKGRLSVRKLGSSERAGREYIGCSVFPACRFFQWVH